MEESELTCICPVLYRKNVVHVYVCPYPQREPTTKVPLAMRSSIVTDLDAHQSLSLTTQSTMWVGECSMPNCRATIGPSTSLKTESSSTSLIRMVCMATRLL